jgi:competence protein ComEC
MSSTIDLWCDNLAANKRKHCSNVQINKNHLSIYFFYVNNESILIILPNKKCILYDCGDVSAAKDVHAKLVQLGVTKLDVMIASHTHKDHVGGFYTFAALPNRQVQMGDLYDNNEDSTDTWFGKYKQFRENLPDHGSYHSMRSSNGTAKLSLDDSVDINLYVSYGWSVMGESSRKYRSIWVRIEYENSIILLAGDSKRAYEKIMINEFQIGRCHILKLSEHGSKESTTESFLEKNQPFFAIACNKDHPNLPHPEVIERLKKKNVKLFSTTKTHNDIELHTNKRLHNKEVAYKFVY